MELHHGGEIENELYKVLASLRGEEEFRMLLEDLCTYKEIEQMAQRLAGAKLLLDGRTYTQITSSTEISSATLSRVSRCIQHGSGGYNTLLRRYLESKKKSD